MSPQYCSLRGHGPGLEAPRGPEKGLGLATAVLSLGLDHMVMVMVLKKGLADSSATMKCIPT